MKLTPFSPEEIRLLLEFERERVVPLLLRNIQTTQAPEIQRLLEYLLVVPVESEPGIVTGYEISAAGRLIALTLEQMEFLKKSVELERDARQAVTNLANAAQDRVRNIEKPRVSTKVSEDVPTADGTYLTYNQVTGYEVTPFVAGRFIFQKLPPQTWSELPEEPSLMLAERENYRRKHT